jgi:hypothetical protein
MDGSSARAGMLTANSSSLGFVFSHVWCLQVWLYIRMDTCALRLSSGVFLKNSTDCSPNSLPWVQSLLIQLVWLASLLERSHFCHLRGGTTGHRLATYSFDFTWVLGIQNSPSTCIATWLNHWAYPQPSLILCFRSLLLQYLQKYQLDLVLYKSIGTWLTDFKHFIHT